MKRSMSILLLIIVAFCAVLIGCSGKNAGDTKAGGNAAEDKKHIKIGCVPVTEPGLKLLQEGMADLGYTVEIVMFDGNNLPATALKDGNLDGVLANHLPWVNTFNKENNCNLQMLKPYYYYSPMSLYSVRYNSVDALPGNAQIIVPGDPTNMDRSLKLLRDAGLLTLGERKGNFYTILDIANNPKNIKIIEAEITTTARSVKDVDAVIAVAAIAKSAGSLDPNQYLYRSQDYSEFPIGVIVNGNNPQAPWMKAIGEVIHSEKCRTAFNKLFQDTYMLFDK